MPCSDGGPVYSNGGENSIEYRIDPETKKRLDKATRLLCYSLRNMNKIHREGLLSNNLELKSWWSNHQEEDKIRKVKEKKQKELKIAKNKALSKLTEKERKLLGL